MNEVTFSGMGRDYRLSAEGHQVKLTELNAWHGNGVHDLAYAKSWQDLEGNRLGTPEDLMALAEILRERAEAGRPLALQSAIDQYEQALPYCYMIQQDPSTPGGAWSYINEVTYPEARVFWTSEPVGDEAAAANHCVEVAQALLHGWVPSEAEGWTRHQIVAGAREPAPRWRRRLGHYYDRDWRESTVR